jgi:LPS-assembly protein
MIARIKFLITGLFLCHLLLAPPLVTSQLRSEISGPTGGPEALDTPQTRGTPPVSTAVCANRAATQLKDGTIICAIRQEKVGEVYKLHSEAEIHYGDYIIHADEATYNSDTGDATADGHFTLDGGLNDDHIKASHGTYNVTTETGRFYDTTGTTGLRFRGNRIVLTSTAPFAFTGKIVEKTSSDHYMVYDGTVTTCELPHPKWKFDAHRVVVDVGGNAKIYRSAFLLDGFPVFYFPFATHPVSPQARQSGFLMPTVGRSSTKGNIVGEGFYWAINRSMDATVGAEYYSLRGWAQHGEFRARPSDSSFVDLNYSGVIDRGIGYPLVKQGGENVRLNSVGNFDGFRGVANIDYLSSYIFRLAFNEIFTQAIYSEVKSQAFVSKSTEGISVSGMVERYQNFFQTTDSQGVLSNPPAYDAIKITHAPSLDASSVDQKFGRAPVYWSFDASLAGLARSEPGQCIAQSNLQVVCTPAFQTGNLLGRFDLDPQISMPLVLHGWSLRPDLTLHETYYTERLDPSTGLVQHHDLNRQAIETSVEIRPPALERVFDKPFFGRKWKHVIEPFAQYRYVTGVNNYKDTLHFDERDILSDTNEVEYGLVTRLFAKYASPHKNEDCNQIMAGLAVGSPAPEQTVPWQQPSTLKAPPCQPGPEVREIVTWELAQKYFLDPTFGGALAAGARNVFTATEDLTGIAFVTEPRHLSPIVSRLKIATSEHTDVEWDLDYDFQLSRVNASTLLANYHAGAFTIGGGDAFLQIPFLQNVAQPQTASSATTAATTQTFQQFRVALGYGQQAKRGLSAATSFGIDADSGLLQFATAETTYNWDCCGMTVEYRRYAIANVRNENLFRFTFSLANIGSLGNLRRQERLY